MAANSIPLEDILAEIKEKTANFDGSNYHGFLAVQVNLTDIKKVFYVEVKDGKLTIAPYDYNDRQANMRISSVNFRKMINGELNGTAAFLTGKLKIDGSIEKCKEMAALFGGSA
ncbi:MAG: SCP2 sterol-binding domain-containing protein [Oscillospiraceae bacterium]|jgi:putative sterol carrier protein|nr:SCP2 sterol-binding domain-containing protein [Oscillospiraceae bacterium]